MSDTKKNMKLKSRRQLLKASIIGTGAVMAGKSLPEKWSRPLVESVVLPAHALTSQISITGSLFLTLVTLDDSIIDTLIPTAHAQSESLAPGGICFDLKGDGTVDVRVLFVYTDDNMAPSEDVPYFIGNVEQGTETPLTLQNGACQYNFYEAHVLVNINGGVASGEFAFANNVATYDGTFSVSDPGCIITDIPFPCLQTPPF